jgi:uncharacterized membrane protein
MEWLLAGGELLVGIVALVLWWLALKMISGDENTKLSSTRFVVFPVVFLLWVVGAVVLVFRGAGLI